MEDSKHVEGRLALVTARVEVSDDWHTIEKAVHSGRHWLEEINIAGMQTMRLCYAGRVSDADVEGTADEMRSLAHAIEHRDSYSATRCAVRCEDTRALFWSPRNSMVAGAVDLEVADDLARQIWDKLGRGVAV